METLKAASLYIFNSEQDEAFCMLYDDTDGHRLWRYRNGQLHT